MKKLSAFILVFLFASNVFARSAKEATALSQLQDLLQNFVSQYRLKVDMDKVSLKFQERFYFKKKKKMAKAKKTFKEQALKINITFKHQPARLMQMPVRSLANRLDQEVIQKFCRNQNLKSKNVRIMVLDPEDYRKPSQVSVKEDIGFRVTAKCVARSKKVRR